MDENAMPTPESRAHGPDIDGTPTVLADGAEWTLAGVVPAWGEIWDRLWDSNVLRGEYDPGDLRLAAFRLLVANYALTIDEAALLIGPADAAALVPAVEAALFGPPRTYRGYSQYLRLALRSCGIDPATVPPEDVVAQVEFLAASGRVLPPWAWVSSAEAAAKKAAHLRIGKGPA